QDEEHDRKGKQIHTSESNGHEMAYYLIDMGDAGSEMEGHEGHGDEGLTHHLMVYITDPEGNQVTGAKTGFLIEGPQGEKQKTMATGMSGGYGADVSLGSSGKYTIRTKAVTEDTTVKDSFEYSTE
ncbi:MAG: hypothetical protein ACLFQ9_04870, partial [Desulfobacterales bacterium]